MPLLQPMFSYKTKVIVTEVGDQSGSETPIRIFVVRKSQMDPILAATVNMPATEFPLL